jgi:hypothetical protein
MPRQEDSAYTITWASGLFTITWAATYAPVSFSSAGYTVVNYTGNNYFGIGADSNSLTTLNWGVCTSPAAASKTLLITAINNLITSTTSSSGFFDTVSTATATGIDLNLTTQDATRKVVSSRTLSAPAISISSSATSTAFGYQALQNNSGATNTAIGYQALATNTTGVDNAAFGNGAGTAILNGQGNVAFGPNALSTMISGSNNIAIGNLALSTYKLNDTIAIGAGSLQNATGSRNTGVGAANLQTVSTGTDNTAVGWLSGQLQPSTGSSNTLVGANAHLGSNQSQNTILGAAASSSADANIVIGYNSSATATNASVIATGVSSTTANEVVVANSTQTVIRPDSDNACDIGTSSKRTKNVYVGTGVVFNNGTLTYDPTNQSQSFIGPFTSSQPVTLRVSIVGKRVTVTFPPLSAAASVALSISTSGALPVAYRPSERISQYIFVKNNGAFVQGLVSIETTGIINVGNTGTTPGTPAAFTASGTAGWEGFSVCYNIA